MADITQLETAFMKAHAAGDAENAGVLAKEIKRLRSPEPVTQAAPRSGMSDFFGGVKKAGTDTVLGVKQLGAMAGIGDKVALEQEAATVKQRDAAMMDTWQGMAGNAVGNIGMALLPGGALKVASKVLPSVPGLSAVANALLAPKSVKGAAALGAGIGVVQPAVNDEERVTNAAIGGVGGAVGNLIPKGVSRVLNPQTDAAVTSLMKQGVTPTPGQVLGGFAQRTEDKLMSVPVLGDAITMGRKRAEKELNQAAYSKALVGTGVDAKKIPVGPDGVGAVKEAVSKQYNALLPKLTFKPDAQFNQELSTIRQMSTGLGHKEQAKFNTLVDDALSKASPNGSMIGQTYRTVESKLSQEAKRFLGSQDAYQKELGDALDSVLDSMKSNLARSNPQYAKELSQANTNFANYARIRDAALMKGDQSGGFSPAQLASAVENQGKKVSKNKAASGQSLMQDLSNPAKQVLQTKYPDSGSVGRGLVAGVIGGAAFANPATLGVLGAVLPYTPPAQKVIAALLAQRPELARNLGNVLGQSSRFGAIPGAGIALSQE